MGDRAGGGSGAQRAQYVIVVASESWLIDAPMLHNTSLLSAFLNQEGIYLFAHVPVQSSQKQCEHKNRTRVHAGSNLSVNVGEGGRAPFDAARSAFSFLPFIHELMESAHVRGAAKNRPHLFLISGKAKIKFE